MFIIEIPNNNVSERKYIIDIFFEEFLNTDYKIKVNSRNDYKIILPNDSTIIIKDSFFNNYHEPLSYLDIKNRPSEIQFSFNKFSIEENLPIIYGKDRIRVDNDKIECDIDIFASSFYMLTRWEEYVIENKDKHSRIPDIEQYSIKYNIHYRPVVNEYLEFLINMFSALGVSMDHNREFKIVITHDVDFFMRYDKLKKVIKAFTGDIIKRKSLKTALQTLSDYRAIRRAEKKDPYDTFDFLMDISENTGNKSIFYFIPALTGEPDANYNINDPAVLTIMDHIKQRGHKIGIHGTYRSYNNKLLYKDDILRIPGYDDLNEVRQHFLRFENPTTWQIQEELGFKSDSTMGFMNDAGFRTGTCFEYSLFNILTRKKLILKEKPLIIMEQALRKRYLNKDDFYETFILLKDIVKKYSGNFVVLWHNNNFYNHEWEGFIDLYKKIFSS